MRNTSKPVAIESLQKLATEIVGDGQKPNLFFVTDRGVVVTVSREFTVAYEHWKQLSRNRGAESALEDRQIGTICSVEPVEEGSTSLIIIDDSYHFGFQR